MSLGPKLRYQILKRDNFTCVLCGKRAPEVDLEVDHIIPKVQGGKDLPDNLRSTCSACNHGKGPHPGRGLGRGESSRAYKIEEHIYKFLMKWDDLPSWGERDLAHLMGLSVEDVAAVCRRLWHRGLVVRRDGQWAPIDVYATPKSQSPISKPVWDV